MKYGVYLESSIVNLKPLVLDFLTKIVDKAKEVRDFAISIHSNERLNLFKNERFDVKLLGK